MSISNQAVTGTDPTNQLFETVKNKTTLDRDDFMNLFVKQLQYQDPMNPMESADMSSQIAQFNMVDLMQKNNEAMEQLVKSDESRTRLHALAFLGKEIRYTGDSLVIGPDGPKPFDLAVEDPAASCIVTITDDQGQLIRSWDLGFLSAGKHPLEWDGLDAEGKTLPEGTYKVDILAMNEYGEEVPTAAWTTGAITQVVYREDGIPRWTVQDGQEITLDEIWIVGD